MRSSLEAASAPQPHKVTEITLSSDEELVPAAADPSHPPATDRAPPGSELKSANTRASGHTQQVHKAPSTVIDLTGDWPLCAPGKKANRRTRPQVIDLCSSDEDHNVPARATQEPICPTPIIPAKRARSLSADADSPSSAHAGKECGPSLRGLDIAAVKAEHEPSAGNLQGRVGPDQSSVGMELGGKCQGLSAEPVALLVPEAVSLEGQVSPSTLPQLGQSTGAVLMAGELPSKLMSAKEVTSATETRRLRQNSDDSRLLDHLQQELADLPSPPRLALSTTDTNEMELSLPNPRSDGNTHTDRLSTTAVVQILQGTRALSPLGDLPKAFRYEFEPLSGHPERDFVAMGASQNRGEDPPRLGSLLDEIHPQFTGKVSNASEKNESRKSSLIQWAALSGSGSSLGSELAPDEAEQDELASDGEDRQSTLQGASDAVLGILSDTMNVDEAPDDAPPTIVQAAQDFPVTAKSMTPKPASVDGSLAPLPITSRRSPSRDSSLEVPLRATSKKDGVEEFWPLPSVSLSATEGAAKGHFLSLKKSSRVLSKAKDVGLPRPETLTTEVLKEPTIPSLAYTGFGEVEGGDTASPTRVNPQEKQSTLVRMSPNVRPKHIAKSRKPDQMRNDLPRIVSGPMQPGEFDYSFHDGIDVALRAEGSNNKSHWRSKDLRVYTPELFEAWLQERGAAEEPEAPPIVLRRAARNGTLVKLNDKDEMPSLDWMYTNRLIFADNMDKVVVPRGGCDCIGLCKPDDSCACAVRQRRAFERNAQDEQLNVEKEHKRPLFKNAPYFAYDAEGRLLIDVDPNVDDVDKLQCYDNLPIHECNSRCTCSKECLNRVISRGRKVPLALALTSKMGWGVFNAGPDDILPGDFIGHYSGEVLVAADAHYREDAVYLHDSSYIFELNLPHMRFDIDRQHLDEEGFVFLDGTAKAIDEIHEARPTASSMHRGTASSSETRFDRFEPKYAIDARFFRNLMGMVNHRCSPNLHLRPFYTDDRDNERPGLAYFAQRVIAPGEQLFVSYKGGHHKFEYLLDPPRNIYNIDGNPADVHTQLFGSGKGRGGGRKSRTVSNKTKTAVVAPVVPVMETNKEETIVYGHNGKPLRGSRAIAEQRIGGLDWSTDLPDILPSAEETHVFAHSEASVAMTFDKHHYEITLSKARTCFCEAPNCDWQMFNVLEFPPVEYEGDASKPPVQLSEDDEGIHIRILDRATRLGSRYVLAQESTFQELIEEHCARKTLDSDAFNFLYEGRNVRYDTQTMADVQPIEDAIIEFWPV